MKFLKNALLAVTLFSSFNQLIHAEGAPVTRDQRVMVVLSEVDSSGIPELAPLYRVMEDLTRHSVHAILGDKYREIITLEDNLATPEKLKEVLFNVARKTEVRAIDMIISVHGSPTKLMFSNGKIKKTDLRDFILKTDNKKDQVAKIFLKKKLRALYNLACYGGENIEILKDLGFAVVNGARGVNANSEVEFLPALTAWANGVGFRDAFALSNNPIALQVVDGPIREVGRRMNNALAETNSEKIFYGDFDVKINSQVQ